MTLIAPTIDKLRNLENLYRGGYRSDVIDRSVAKLIALERMTAEQELTRLGERLALFEQNYGMTSEDFYRQFRLGELDDSAEFVEWSVFWEMRQSVCERLDVLGEGV